MSNTQRIAELKAELEQLEATEKVLATMDPEHRIAIKLHEMLCHHNHVDGCGWEYESQNGLPNWDGHAHARYLSKASHVKSFCQCYNVSEDAVLKLFEHIRGY